MRIKKFRWLILGAFFWIALFSARFAFSNIDYSRIDKGLEPIFSYEIAQYKDGGTIEYQGLGYRAVSLKRLYRGKDKILRNKVGPSIKYELNWLLLPMTDKSDFRFEKYE